VIALNAQFDSALLPLPFAPDPLPSSVPYAVNVSLKNQCL